MRIEQLTLNPPLFAPQIYNAFFTVHGVIMIFMFVLPGLGAVFGNFFLPIMIGARDVAFPRLNLLSWYFFHRRRSHCDFLSFYRKRPAGYRMDFLCSFQPENRDQCHPGRFRSFRSGLFFHSDGTELSSLRYTGCALPA